jgi:hypothetical protein
VSYLARPAPSMPMRRVAPHMDVSLWSPASTFATSRLELFTKSVTPNFRLPKEDPRCLPAWGRSGPLGANRAVSCYHTATQNENHFQ